MKIAISAGHGLHIRGAAGSPIPPMLDEYDENVNVMRGVANHLAAMGVECQMYTDTVSTTQSENLNRLCNWHNDVAFGGGKHDLDVSIHFNAYDGKAHGTECLYVTQEELAQEVAAAVAKAAHITDRGAKYRGDLAFLNNTREPAILIEMLFCDNRGDCDAYHRSFDDICGAIAEAISDEAIGPTPVPPDDEALLYVRGTCSWFGGPGDDGVAADEGLAFIYDVDEAPHLFLPEQPPQTSGLARRLDGGVFYVACRWDYDVTPKEMLRDQTRKAIVRAKGKEFLAFPADWGPNEQTGRVADLSSALLEALELETDDEVEVIYPAP